MHDPDHLQKCREYWRMKESMEGAGGLGVTTGSNKRPALTCEDEDEENTPPLPKAKRISPTTAILPHGCRHPLLEIEEGGHRRKQHSIWDCLCCGKDTCGFERGMTIMNDHDGQGDEYDPCEVSPSSSHSSEADKRGGRPKFEEVKTHLHRTIEAILKSKGFWSANKYLGSPNLDIKIKSWLKLKIAGDRLVEIHWLLLRRGVKEALRYKRQDCVSAMQREYTSMYYSPGCLFCLLACISSS